MIRRYVTGLRAPALGASALIAVSTFAHADQTIVDDLIVQGSACIGQDCNNGESFGFDTIRLKENNLRIRAFDTSTSASFPTNDWQITFNDSSNGGANKFSIDDIDSGRTPLTIIAGAPTNAIYIDAQGDLGLGTSTPVVGAHMVNGNTPTLRLEQDGSAGFQSQTWDVAGNEANFFVRDATNGSALPFKIKPGAPDNSLYIDASGKIGSGTASPSAGLHIRRSDGLAQVNVEDLNATQTKRVMLAMTNKGDPAIQFNNTVHPTIQWEFRGGSRLIIDDTQDSQTTSFLFDLHPTGDLTIAGELTTNGSCSVGCDRVFEESYEIVPIAARIKQMWENGYLPNVGPTPEDGPFNVSDKMGRMLNELEHAHIYIGQLHERLAKLEATLVE